MQQPADPRGDALTIVRKANWAIEKVTGDMVGRLAFNTAIAAIMELINELYRHPQADRRPGGSRPQPRPRSCSRSRPIWAPRCTSG